MTATLSPAPQTARLTPDLAARWFFYSAVFWLIVPVLAGLVMAVFLFDARTQEWVPEPLRPAIIFGRLRPLHVNLAMFGWLSMVYAGCMLFLTPRLCATPLYSERLGRVTLVLWNLLVVGAAVSLPLGFTQGREYAELVWPLDVLLLVCFGLMGVNVWGTVLRRTEPRMYITVWSFLAATAIAPLVYAIGNRVWDFSGAYSGVSDAIVNYFYVHNIFNVWFTTMALGLFFYLLPRLTGNPLFSHRLALWGFSSVWTGQHHLLYGPGPEWLEILSVSFSILAAIGNVAFLLNSVKTMQGAWNKLGSNLPLRFLATGCLFYFLTCVQGIAQSFRGFNAYVHFTNWVIGHSHLALVGAYSFLCIALVYYVMGRSLDRPVSRRLMEWHYWLTLCGLSVFMVSLWIAGLIQGQNWSMGGVPFLETVRSLKPFFFIRLLAGAAMVAGQLVFALALWRLVRGRQDAAGALQTQPVAG